MEEQDLEKLSELFSSLLEAQKEFPAFNKDATAGKGNFAYKYITLDSIIAIVRPILHRHGLGFTQMLSSDGINTIIFHKNGSYIQSGNMEITIDQGGKMNDTQKVGSGATYAKRYQLGAMLGISTEEDTDGATGGDNDARGSGVATDRVIPSNLSTFNQGKDNWFGDKQVSQLDDMLGRVSSESQLSKAKEWAKSHKFAGKYAEIVNSKFSNFKMK